MFRKRFKLKKKSLSFSLLGILFLSLTACSQVTLNERLDEKNVNLMLQVLQDSAGITSAKKVKVGEGDKASWNLEVSPKDEALARRTLNDYNLPYPKMSGSEECHGGFIPSPEQERCEARIRLENKIVNLLKNDPAIIDASIVLNLPAPDPFARGDETQPSKRPTSSAILKIRSSNDGQEITDAKIQHIVAKSVENLDPRDVEVRINYIRPLKKEAPPVCVSNLINMAGLNLDEKSKGTFKIYALSMLALLLGMAAALVLSLLKMTKLRRTLGSSNSRNTLMTTNSETKLIQKPEE